MRRADTEHFHLTKNASKYPMSSFKLNQIIAASKHFRALHYDFRKLKTGERSLREVSLKVSQIIKGNVLVH